MSKPWTAAENEAVIDLYFGMLGRAKSGVAYSKAAMIRAAQGQAEIPTTGYTITFGPLASRSKGSIEFKLMNCSAAHLDIDPGATTMHGFGYRELSNYQADLKAIMRKQLKDALCNCNDPAITRHGPIGAGHWFGCPSRGVL